MKVKESVSVIITCYNLQGYIDSAIESVLAQDWTEDFEIIVVDDASMDESVEVISKYKDIRLIRMPVNSGVLLATIAGIVNCTGEYVFFLDGDDCWKPQKIRLVIDAFKRDNDIGLVTHDLDFIGIGGQLLKDMSSQCHFLESCKNPGAMVEKGILSHSSYVWLGSAYAVRKSKVELSNFCCWAQSLPNPRETYQDWPLAYWCVSIDSVKCAYIPQKLLSYRVHGANYSGDARTVHKAIGNLKKGYFTIAAICQICRIRGLRGYPYWLSKGKELYYSCMIDLYSERRLIALFKFVRLQPYLILSSNLFTKEWLRFLAIFFLGSERFTLAIKG